MSTQSSGYQHRDNLANGKIHPNPQDDARIMLFPETAAVFVWLNFDSDRRECVITSVADAEGLVRSTQSHLVGVGRSCLRIYVGHLEPGHYSVRTILDQAPYVNWFVKVAPIINPR